MKSVEEAAKEYSQKIFGKDESTFLKGEKNIFVLSFKEMTEKSFQAGALWQAEQAKVLEDALEERTTCCTHDENDPEYRDRDKEARFLISNFRDLLLGETKTFSSAGVKKLEASRCSDYLGEREA